MPGATRRVSERDYVEIATTYAQQVVDGEIIACQLVQQACQRQLDDLHREDFPYKFSTDRAAHVCRFIELLPHIKGEWAGKLIVLEPWQIFLLTTIFGWIDSDGYRRYKTAYVEVPRKNAKSTLASGIALYMLTADGEGGPEVYSAATTRDQARIVWQDAKRMVDKSPGLRDRFGIQTAALSIFSEADASVFKPLSRDQGGNLDGLNVHAGIVDELHAHKTRDVWDVLETGTGARRQPLLMAITTAGANRAGICYEQRAYVIKILSGVAADPEYFGIIYTIDDGDDWTDPACWQKANPNWGVSVNPNDVVRLARKAMEMASAVNNFLTKRLNKWVNADTAWMDMRRWEAVGNPELRLEDFAGRPARAAIDLSTKTDIAPLVIVVETEEGKQVVFGRHYLPEAAVEDGRNSQYSGWDREGRLISTPGDTTDFARIEDDLREIAGIVELVEVGYDPWQAAYLAQRLEAEGMPMVEVRQTVQNMSEPMKTLEAWVLEGKLIHDGCPVMTWMMSNVVAHEDAKENIYPRKEFRENKIDGVVALIMAINRILADDGPATMPAGYRMA